MRAEQNRDYDVNNHVDGDKDDIYEVLDNIDFLDDTNEIQNGDFYDDIDFFADAELEDISLEQSLQNQLKGMYSIRRSRGTEEMKKRKWNKNHIIMCVLVIALIVLFSRVVLMKVVGSHQEDAVKAMNNNTKNEQVKSPVNVTPTLKPTEQPISTSEKKPMNNQINDKKPVSDNVTDETKDNSSAINVGPESNSGKKNETNDAIKDKPVTKVEDMSKIATMAKGQVLNLKKTAFVGNSLTQGFQIANGLKESTVYAKPGLTVSTIASEKCAKLGNQTVTVLDALKNQQFQWVFFMFGINEIGWNSDKIFIEKYSDLIESIKKKQPNTNIVVQSILPVDEDKVTNSIFNNERIDTFNKEIKEMCNNLQITYLDVSSIMKDSDGQLYGEASTDGIHLKKKYYTDWMEFIKNKMK